jgi:hypothetical protein
MRTTLNIDPQLVDELVAATGEKDRGKAVNRAIREFIRRQKLDQLIALAGNIEMDDVWEEMEKLELEKMAKREW